MVARIRVQNRGKQLGGLRWRSITWALITTIFSVLMLTIMIIDGPQNVGVAWFFGILVLGIMWAGSNSPRRRCSHCNHRLPAAFRICTLCGRQLRPSPMVGRQETAG
jgi:hypothetical protein